MDLIHFDMVITISTLKKRYSVNTDCKLVIVDIISVNIASRIQIRSIIRIRGIRGNNIKLPYKILPISI